MPAKESTAQPSYSIETSFGRDINRYRWLAGLTVAQPINNRTVRLSNRFSSDAFILFNDLLSFRDENVLYWSLDPRQGRPRDLALRGHLATYSQSRVLSQDVYGFTSLQLFEMFRFSPALGFAMDQRPGAVRQDGSSPLRRDIGPAFDSQLTLPSTTLGGYTVQFDATGNLQMINPRRSRLLRMNGRAERLFDQTKFSSTVFFSNVRRDAYQGVSFLNRDNAISSLSETIEATTSDTLLVRLDLDTPLNKSIQLTNRFDFTSNNRKIRTLRTPEESLFFDTDFNRRRIDVEVGLRLTTRRITSQLTAIGTTEVEQRQLVNRDQLPDIQATQKGDLLEQADYDRSIIGIRMQNRLYFHNNLIMNLEGSANILRHDTPEINQDDRDESFFSGQASIEYIINRYVAVQVDVFGTYYHTVYLKARRSAENNVQRSLRFRPTVTWTPTAETSVRLQSEVRATYTEDDFVLEGRRPTDQSARELQYNAEFQQRIGDNLALLINGGSNDLRLGRFLSGSFSEIPFDTLQTYSGWIRLQSQGPIQAEIGARAFIRTDYERASTVRYRRIDDAGNIERDETGNSVTSTITRPGRRWIEQIGPTFAITWAMTDGSALRMDGWLNVQRIRQRLYGDLPEGLANHIRSEARRGIRTTIPNLSVSVLWRL